MSDIVYFDGERIVLEDVGKEPPFSKTEEAQRLRMQLEALGLARRPRDRIEELLDSRLADLFDGSELEEVRNAVADDLRDLDQLNDDITALLHG